MGRVFVLAKTLGLLGICHLVSATALAHSPHQHEHNHSHNHAHTHSHGAHVHGEVAVSIAAVDNELMISWRSPAGDVVGFEHAPENDEQREEIERQLAWLATADWVSFDGRSQCSLADAQAQSEQLQADRSGHNDIYVDLHWRCNESLSLRQVSLDITDRFPALTTIRYEWVTESQAGSGSVESSLGTIRLR